MKVDRLPAGASDEKLPKDFTDDAYTNRRWRCQIMDGHCTEGGGEMVESEAKGDSEPEDGLSDALGSSDIGQPIEMEAGSDEPVDGLSDALAKSDIGSDT